MVSTSGANIHDPNENNHYYRQNSSPTSIAAGGGDPLQVGDLWSDTTANLLKRCTGVNADTFASVEGGGAGAVTAAADFDTDGVLIRSDGTTKGVQKSGVVLDDNDDLTGLNSLRFTAPSTLTISNGDVTRTGFSHLIAGESGSTDNLDGIIGGEDQMLLRIRPSLDSVDITVRHNQYAGQTKNILLTGLNAILTANPQPYRMREFADQMVLIYESALDTNGAWTELVRSTPIIADSSVLGVVEHATGVEIAAGSGAGVILASSLANSIPGTRFFIFKIIANDTTLTTGDNLNNNRFVLPDLFDGYNLFRIRLKIFTASSSGLPTFQLRNVTQAADILSTPVSVDENETDSINAAAPAVVDTNEDDYTNGDELQFDCDIAGTGAKGAELHLAYRIP